MADNADGGGNDVFVYMGGNQVVPWRVTHIRIHRSVKIIRQRTFRNCISLEAIEMHDGVEIIEGEAFHDCRYLRRINLSGVRVIGTKAFWNCKVLEDVEFGDKLLTIGNESFRRCFSLRIVKLPKVRVIGNCAFSNCYDLTDVELSEDLERIENEAFNDCRRLRRIAIPLKDNLLGIDVFNSCNNLSQVDIVGGIHKTVSSLLPDNWRNEMKDEIGRINQVLPNTDNGKSEAIQRWIPRVLEGIGHYKSEHYALLKDAMMQLELALWDANLPNVDAAASRSRHDARVTCGANIIIPHVLSFLNDEEVFPTVRTIPL